MVKLDTLNPPSCWNYESPEERAGQVVYWACPVYTLVKPITGWCSVFVSKKEAESYAASGGSGLGIWDHGEARPYTLETAMQYAREKNRPGVRICTWDGEGKVILKEIPV